MQNFRLRIDTILGVTPSTDSIHEKIHQGIGHGHQIVLPTGMDPCVDHLVHRTVDQTFDQPHEKVSADAPLLLAQLHDFGDNIPIGLGHCLDMLIPEPAVLMGFGLVNDGHIAILLKLLEMDPNQTPQLFLGCFGLTDRIPESFKDLACLVLVELNQNIVLVLEIEIDGSVRHTSLFGNLGDCRLKKPLLGKHFDGGFEDALVFLRIFLFGGDGEPPVKPNL